nr:ANTAR domain-containing protein [Aeromicrobium sp. CFBP 8757]
MERQTTVWQAQGMIMQRFGVTPARAFAALERASHRRGVMPHRLAEDVLAAGVDVLARDADLV